jgi:hypothetical protein
MSDFSDKDTEWNFALAYLRRIDQLLQKCNYYKGIRDFDNWWLSIDSVHTEIQPRFENKEGDEVEKLRTIAKNQVTLYIKKNNIDRNIIHDSLNAYERYLRNILRLRGMDMPKKTDPGHSLLNQDNN